MKRHHIEMSSDQNTSSPKLPLPPHKRNSHSPKWSPTLKGFHIIIEKRPQLVHMFHRTRIPPCRHDFISTLQRLKRSNATNIGYCSKCCGYFSMSDVLLWAFKGNRTICFCASLLRMLDDSITIAALRSTKQLHY